MPGIPTRAFVSIQSMTSIREFHVFGWNVVFLQGGVKHAAVFRWNRAVIHGMSHENRRGFLGHLFLVGKELHYFGIGVVAEQVALGTAVGVFAHGHHGVDQNGKVGPAGNPVEGVLGGRSSCFGKVSGRCGGQVSACGKSKDTHLVGVDLPFLGPVPDQSDGPLGILERNEGTTLGQTVLEHHTGNAVVVEPLGDAVSLGAHDEPTVASARADNGSCAVGFGRSV